MIPVLVRWAQSTWDKPHYYSDLTTAVGHKTNQIGKVMVAIQVILDDLQKQYHKNIPTLNSLVMSKSSDLPSDGFDYVIPNYSKLSQDSKRGEVRKLNMIAHEYDWSWVLKALNLKPALIISKSVLENIKVGSFGKGGEGAEHKALKEYIHNHPESIGIMGVKFSETEHALLSGDSLDIYFECSRKKHYAIEVKPKSSPKEDIRRGVFQCVKYKSVMDAERVLYNDNYENDALLVLAGKMPDSIKQIANDLGVKYKDNFKF